MGILETSGTDTLPPVAARQRLFAANEVRAAGHGALRIVSEITGLARSTINRGEDDLDDGPLPEGRVRRKGGGPKPLSERQLAIEGDAFHPEWNYTVKPRSTQPPS